MSIKSKSNLSSPRNILYLTILFLGIAPSILDSYKNPFTFFKYFHIDSAALLTISLIILTILKIRLGGNLPKTAQNFLLRIALPILLILGIGLSIIDFLTPANFVYSIIHTNYQRLFVAGIGCLYAALLFADTQWLKKKKNTIFFLSSFVLLAILCVIGLWPFDILKRISNEDSVIEYCQFFILSISFFFSSLTAKKLFNSKNIHLGVVYAVIAIGFFATAGDEISWGQRLINFQTPETIRHQNYQEEVSWHNLDIFTNIPHIAYTAIGFYGSLAWIITKIIPMKNKVLSLFIPQWFLFGYFFIPFIFNLRIMLGPHYLGMWSESVEMILYAGAMLFLGINYKDLKKILKK